MAKTILTENQTNLLFAISGDKEICRCFISLAARR
jgi:hypothetical protein